VFFEWILFNNCAALSVQLAESWARDSSKHPFKLTHSLSISVSDGVLSAVFQMMVDRLTIECAFHEYST